MLSKNGNHLFSYAQTKLRPDIFSHPIWIRFGKKDTLLSIKILDNLFQTVKDLGQTDPSAACQILLICAFYQNNADRQVDALKTTHQAQVLAENAGLKKEAIWARWGTCAIYIQESNFQQAARTLAGLITVLNDQNEWVLATYIGEFKEYLSKIVAGMQDRSRSAQDHRTENLLSHTFYWLQHWGYAASIPESGNGEYTSRTTAIWQKLFKIIRLPFLTSLLNSTGITQSKERGLTQPYEPHPNPYFRPPSSTKNIPDRVVPPAQEKHISPDRNSQTGGNPKPDYLISVSVQMLGAFSIIIQDLTLQLPSSRGLSVFKYILLHHRQNIPREMLMEVFWPEAEPETARNNLNVAIYSLRRALRKVTKIQLIVYKNGTYGLDPNLRVWLDVDEFDQHVQAGKQSEKHEQMTAAIENYESAISIYQGDFLEENPYEEWTVADRERLRIAYLDMLDCLAHLYFDQERYAACITVCQLLLRRDRCREDSHCLLMRCYSRQGQRHLALRQYHICLEALREELEVEPEPETVRLYEYIRKMETI